MVNLINEVMMAPVKLATDGKQKEFIAIWSKCDEQGRKYDTSN